MILIYLCSSDTSVFSSQVVEYLNFIFDKKIFDEIYLLVGLKNKRNDALNNIINGINIVSFKQFPNFSFFSLLQKFVLSSAFKKIPCVNGILHIRTESYNKIISQILQNQQLNLRVVVDIRGATIEESKYYNGHNYFYKFCKIKFYANNLKVLEHLIFNISVVSPALKNYVEDLVPNIVGKIHVVECLAGKNFYFSNSKRERIRKLLNIQEKTAFVFTSGGSYNWQNFEKLFSYFENTDYVVLNLSPFYSKHKNIINLNVPYNLVSQYLCAADIAIIWRENNVVNKVASPVKFSEYIRCGLPVVCNNSVDIIVDYIKSNNYGAILNDLKEINEDLINKLRNINRIEISKASFRFSVDIISSKYLKIYGIK